MINIVFTIFIFMILLSISNPNSEQNHQGIKKHTIALAIIVFIMVAICFWDMTRININTASQKELMKLNGIGEVKSEMIIDNRPIKNHQDLLDFLTYSQVGKIRFKVKY